MDEIDIDTRLAHRVGSPILPVLPVSFAWISDEASISKDIHRIPVVQILRDNGINQREALQCIRTNQSGQGGRTLLIFADFEPNVTSNWVNAVTQIRQDLIAFGLEDFFVEITDPRKHQNEAIDKDNLVLCQELLPSIYANMEGHAWVTVDFLRCFSHLHGEIRPTVAISAADADDERWWEITLPSIKEAIAGRLELNLFCLKSVFTTDIFHSEKPDVLFRYRNYDPEIGIGASCGLGGSESTGTLGGRVTLQTKDGNQTHLGLTNFHVLLKGALFPQGKQITSQSQSILTSMIDKATGPGRVPANLAAFSPSDNDHELFVAKMDRELNETRDLLDTAQEREIAFGRQPEDGDSRRLAYAKAQFDAASLNRELADSPRRLGNIYAASGITVGSHPHQPGDWILDWCLVQPDGARTIESQIRTVDDFVKIPKGAAISKYQSISATETYEVVKFGRSSGWTRGTIAGLSMVNPDQENSLVHSAILDPESPSIANILMDVLDAPTLKDHQYVLCHSMISSDRSKRRFLLPGDSGCLVLLNQDIEGAAVAVGLGFAENKATGAAYMIPMDIVFQDIESVCGGRVVEPSMV
ncbi:hypothetical protein BS50DRAFT_632642 [Corynespora cassiicola Philippines]|uniref:Uncharacterized protein n=1 Tax=Corynespora cassiicola Philippines TaxID=1448308 RepID=A0A2T2NTP9_CORCC|nr:hypothetical protein BS50DRAFT_632642 [Corynespora cassiicola Philippines]